MRKVFLIWLSYLVGVGALAQDFPSEVWHEGKTVLASGDTLVGSIKYSIDNDLIQVDINNTVQTYSSRKIAYFEIFDVTVDNFRHFYSLPYNIKPNYKIPILFEVLYEGPMALLAREMVILETIPQSNFAYGSSYTRRKLTYEYYFLEQGSDIERYGGKKNDLIYIMDKHSAQMKKFIKKNKLHHDRRNDLIKITTYYNNLLEAS